MQEGGSRNLLRGACLEEKSFAWMPLPYPSRGDFNIAIVHAVATFD
jgi:hypothetical protein